MYNQINTQMHPEEIDNRKPKNIKYNFHLSLRFL